MLSNFIKNKKLKVFVGSIFFLLFMREPAYAGSLNAREQELIAIIKGTYTYQGVTYRVKDTYIQVAIDYLLQDDIDVTEEQKQKALNKMYSSIQQGIDEGYLEAVDDGTMVMEGSIIKTPEEETVGTWESVPETAAETMRATEEDDAEVLPIEIAEDVLSLENYGVTENVASLLPEKENGDLKFALQFPWDWARGAIVVIALGSLAGTVAAMRAKLLVHRKKRKRGRLS